MEKVRNFIEITECWEETLDEWQESVAVEKFLKESKDEFCSRDDFQYDFAFSYDVFDLTEILINSDRIKFIKPKAGIFVNTLELRSVTQIFFENDDYVIALECYDVIKEMLESGEANG